MIKQRAAFFGIVEMHDTPDKDDVIAGVVTGFHRALKMCERIAQRGNVIDAGQHINAIKLMPPLSCKPV